VIDHLVYAVPDLEAASEELASSWGVRPAFGGVHKARGTHNALLSFGGGAYLEIIAPDPGQSVAPSVMPFGLLGNSPAHLRTFAIKAPGIDAVVEQARQRGFDPGPAQAMSRDLPGGGGTLRWRLTRQDKAAYSGDGLIPFLIDWGDAAHPSQASPGGCSLVSLRAAHPDPGPIRKAYEALGLDIAVAEGPQPSLIATISTPNGERELR
jgi:hypothetical protein